MVVACGINGYMGAWDTWRCVHLRRDEDHKDIVKEHHAEEEGGEAEGGDTDGLDEEDAHED